MFQSCYSYTSLNNKIFRLHRKLLFFEIRSPIIRRRPRWSSSNRRSQGRGVLLLPAVTTKAEKCSQTWRLLASRRRRWRCVGTSINILAVEMRSLLLLTLGRRRRVRSELLLIEVVHLLLVGFVIRREPRNRCRRSGNNRYNSLGQRDGNGFFGSAVILFGSDENGIQCYQTWWIRRESRIFGRDSFPLRVLLRLDVKSKRWDRPIRIPDRFETTLENDGVWIENTADLVVLLSEKRKVGGCGLLVERVRLNRRWIDPCWNRFLVVEMRAFLLVWWRTPCRSFRLLWAITRPIRSQRTGFR